MGFCRPYYDLVSGTLCAAGTLQLILLDRCTCTSTKSWDVRIRICAKLGALTLYRCTLSELSSQFAHNMDTNHQRPIEAATSAPPQPQTPEPAWIPQPPPGHPPDPAGRHPLEDINEDSVPAYEIGTTNAFVASVAEATGTRAEALR